jgi:hypothetical protein
MKKLNQKSEFSEVSWISLNCLRGLISQCKPFLLHNFGAAIANDLSPNVACDRTRGVISTTAVSGVSFRQNDSLTVFLISEKRFGYSTSKTVNIYWHAL